MSGIRSARQAVRRSRTGIIVVVALGALATSGCAQLNSRPSGPRVELDSTQFEPPPPCPVCGEPVNFAIRIKRTDGLVHFSSMACIDEFRRDPEAHAEMVEMQREMLRYRPRIQVRCPIRGDPISKRRYTDRFGERVYFCSACGACPGMYEEDPERYKAALAASYTYQTRCPVSGCEINPKAYTELGGGRRIYFCSRGCRRQYGKAPELFAANLAAQGVVIDGR